MNPSSDTIVALSTPRGYSGIGVLRISGPDAVSVLGKIFRPLNSSNPLTNRVATYGKVVESESGRVVDDGIAVVMPGPFSYTGDDVVELSLHGSPVVLDLVERNLVRLGCRPAQRGEFTRRAFLAGRLDLVQAEAVIDLIEATGPAAVDEARARLDGSASMALRAVSHEIKNLLAEVEAHIDFDEDDLEPPPSPEPSLRRILSAMDTMIKGSERGRLGREGIRTVIAGKPNVGKSTLFNAMLRADRAIVTPHPGTTRDFLEERALIDGMIFLLSDTAGVRENPEPVEKEGIRRTRNAIAEADIVVMVLDSSQPLDHEDLEVLAACQDKTAVLALNKTDLGTAIDGENRELGSCPHRMLSISAWTGAGLDELERLLADLGRARTSAPTHEAAPSLTPRATLLMESARIPLQNLLGLFGGNSCIPAEIVSLELRRSLAPLEEITGERVDEGILERVFDRFCVGK